MEYELANQLKYVGFPQTKAGNGYYINCRDTIIPDGKVLESDSSRDITYVPTLEELIEACGIGVEDFNLVRRFIGGSNRTIWYAEMFSRSDNNTIEYKEKGKTPLIAVAKLFIKLEKDG